MKFKVGDKVICVNNSMIPSGEKLTIGKEYTVLNVDITGDTSIQIREGDNVFYYFMFRFKLANYKELL
jgi:hypothetical protein